MNAKVRECVLFDGKKGKIVSQRVSEVGCKEEKERKKEGERE